MLIITEKMNELSFGRLMELYAEENLNTGRIRWPEEPQWRQVALAEEEFREFLCQVFFRTAGARYLICEEQGWYVSALRLEPYRDGLLLEALETAPDCRRKGYASGLIQAAILVAAEQKIYAHVDHHNAASLRTHEKCGFIKLLDYAAYIDGSVDSRCCTLCHFPQEK